MAVKRWISTTGDGSDAGSWRGGVLGSGDTGLLDGVESQVDWSAGLSPASGVKVRSTPNYRGNIGSSGNPLTLTHLTPLPSWFQHNGRLHLVGDTSSRIFIDNPQQDRTSYHIDGNCAVLYIRGGATLAATLTVTSGLWIFPGSNVLIEEGFTLSVGPIQNFGTLENRSAEVVDNYAGETTQTKQVTQIVVYGGTVIYDPRDRTPADIGLNILNGTLDIPGGPGLFSSQSISGTIGPRSLILGDSLLDGADVSGLADLREQFPD